MKGFLSVTGKPTVNGQGKLYKEINGLGVDRSCNNCVLKSHCMK